MMKKYGLTPSCHSKKNGETAEARSYSITFFTIYRKCKMNKKTKI